MREKEPVKSRVLGIRLTDDEYARIQEEAEVAGLTASKYMRRRVLGHVVTAHSDLTLINELRRQGGLLKLCMRSFDAKDVDRFALNVVLRDMKNLIKKLSSIDLGGVSDDR